MQPVDLELLDLEVSDNRSPDRKPANGQGAEGAGTNGRCADHGGAKASRSKLHRGPLPPARTERGKGPRPTGNLSRDDVASNRNIAELLGTSFLTPPGEGGRR